MTKRFLGTLSLTLGVLVAVVSPAWPETPAIAQSAPTPVALLPHDLSPWGMFMGADPLVKGILLGLALASVVTWTIGLAKSLEIAAAGRRARRARATLLAASTLEEVGRSLHTSDGIVSTLAATAIEELNRSGPDLSPDGIKERIAMRFQRLEAAEGRRLMRGTGILATIGATGPFIGLFGTVWGIMNSFIGISKAQTTNLAVVAPGIAEALLATAVGLAAAIPAVVIYNAFARSIAAYRALVADASTEIMRTTSRDLDRHAAAMRTSSPSQRSALAAE